MAAASFAILGLESLLGVVGIAMGGVIMMLVGNPFSGMTSAPEMLPGWSGQLGQLLPPGAAGSLLRSTSFFDGAGSAGHVAVLLVWMAAGLALCMVSGMRAARRAPARHAEPTREPVAAAAC